MHIDSIGTARPFAPDDHPSETTDDPSRPGAAPVVGDASQLQARLARLVAENIELRAEIEQLKADRKRMADIQLRLMEVLNCKSPDKLVHDVRNILNERELYRALADTVM